MKKLELKQIIKEEIRRVVKENTAAGIPDDVPYPVRKMWDSGEFVRIDPTTQLQKGDEVVGINNSVFYQIRKIAGDMITIQDDAYGSNYQRKREVLELYFLIRKKK